MQGIGEPDPEGPIPVSWTDDRPPRPSKAGFVHRLHPSMDVPLHVGTTIPVVQTDRLLMVGPTESHVDGIARIAYDPRVAEWFGGVPDPMPDHAAQREEIWRYIATFLGHWSLRGFGQWVLLDRNSGEVVGRAGLWQPEGWPGVEVGWMVDPQRWGEGLATEAGRASVDIAFDRLGLDEVISVTIPPNAASRRVMEKVGLTDTGTTVELRGHTQVLYRITRDEWLADVRTPSTHV